jgi:transposase
MSFIYYIGIDISKEWFDAAVHAKAAKPQRFPNSSEGFAAFVREYLDILSDSLIVLEATGGYETALLLNLHKAGACVHRIQPLKSAHYIRSLRVNGKTDALDAIALARYGAERHESLAIFQPADEVLQTLQYLQMRRSDLVAMRATELQRAKHPRYAQLHASVREVCELLDRQIENIEKQMAELVDKTDNLKQKYQIMRSFKGIGNTTAMCLLACMPELGSLTRKEAAALAGLAPYPRDSGKTAGYRATRGGRKNVRNALFMAALSAKAYNPQLKTFYDRLIKNGKKPIVALAAVMRKIIVILNAKIRDACYA